MRWLAEFVSKFGAMKDGFGEVNIYEVTLLLNRTCLTDVHAYWEAFLQMINIC